MTSVLTNFSILNVVKMFVAVKRAASGLPNPTPFYLLLLNGEVRFSHGYYTSVRDSNRHLASYYDHLCEYDSNVLPYSQTVRFVSYRINLHIVLV